MIRATQVITAADGAMAIQDTVTLRYDDRHRRRMAMTTDGGDGFLLDLPEAHVLRHGDTLILDDGRRVGIKAANEPVAEIIARDPHHLIRIAWHLGNRHLPTHILPDRLRIRQDHVIEDMAERLGARVERKEAPFDPEGGAYGHGATHGHDHGHGHGHGHAHDHG